MSTLDPSDGELLRNIAAGDDAALRLLYERHAGWLLRPRSRRCLARDDRRAGDDVIRDVAAFSGVATPASGISAAVISLALFLALVRPLVEWAPIFPYLADGDWQSSRVIWTVLAAVSLAALAVTMSSKRALTRSSPRSACVH